jgi:hypothetical protein
MKKRKRRNSEALHFSTLSRTFSLLILYFILYTLYFILYTSYFILHTLYFILYTSYFILSSYFLSSLFSSELLCIATVPQFPELCPHAKRTRRDNRSFPPHTLSAITFFSSFHTTTMLGKDIASMEAFNVLPNGNYDNVEADLQSFVGVAASAKALKKKLTESRTNYVTKIDGKPAARVSVLGKGADTDIQFAPTAAFLAALDAVIAAVNTYETAVGLVDFPTA